MTTVWLDGLAQHDLQLPREWQGDGGRKKPLGTAERHASRSDAVWAVQSVVRIAYAKCSAMSEINAVMAVHKAGEIAGWESLP